MSELTKRLLGMTSNDEGNASSNPVIPEKEDGASDNAQMVGLHDAVLSGLFQDDTGELFRGIPIDRGDVVLDVGCGEGGMLGFCARRGAYLIAVDTHEATLDIARKRLSDVSGQAIEFYCAQAHSLPLADETASRVICTEVLEHVDDPASVIKELNRVGKSGALYLFSVPDALGETMFAKVAPENYFQAPNHVRVFERDAFARLIEQGGLEIISHTMTGFFWSIWWALYWGCKPDLSNPHHPVLDHWTKAWHTLVQSDTGRKLKHQLDDFMPKSQFIVARKPAAAAKHQTQKEG